MDTGMRMAHLMGTLLMLLLLILLLRVSTVSTATANTTAATRAEEELENEATVVFFLMSKSTFAEKRDAFRQTMAEAANTHCKTDPAKCGMDPGWQHTDTFAVTDVEISLEPDKKASKLRIHFFVSLPRNLPNSKTKYILAKDSVQYCIAMARRLFHHHMGYSVIQVGSTTLSPVPDVVTNAVLITLICLVLIVIIIVILVCEMISKSKRKSIDRKAEIDDYFKRHPKKEPDGKVVVLATEGSTTNFASSDGQTGRYTNLDDQYADPTTHPMYDSSYANYINYNSEEILKYSAHLKKKKLDPYNYNYFLEPNTPGAPTTASVERTNGEKAKEPKGWVVLDLERGSTSKSKTICFENRYFDSSDPSERVAPPGEKAAKMSLGQHQRSEVTCAEAASRERVLQRGSRSVESRRASVQSPTLPSQGLGRVSETNDSRLNSAPTQHSDSVVGYVATVV